MATFVGAQTFGPDLLTALGIDPDTVMEFNLHCSVHEMPRLSVTSFVEQPEGGFLPVLSKYRVSLDDTPPTRPRLLRLRPARIDADLRDRAALVLAGVSVELVGGA